jgi:ribonucleotide reductase beta subunit family protein with ferritin-like domain
MFGAFTEGMALFASFAMLLNFPRHNKMNGMGQIVSWSVRDESLHCKGASSCSTSARNRRSEPPYPTTKVIRAAS